MDETSVKNKVLQELIDTMEAKITDGLKSKSPKFMKMEVESEVMPSEAASESMDSEAKTELPKEMGEQDDDLERLKELYAQLK
jgi:hypothetical protein